MFALLLATGACSSEPAASPESLRFAASADGRTAVCHRTNSAEKPFVVVQLPQAAVAAHLDHGDTLHSETHGCEQPPLIGASCQAIKAQSPSAPDGIYTIEPAGGPQIQVHCLMSADGGGWTLVGNYPASQSNVDGWVSGAQVGSGFTDLTAPFKLTDAAINTLVTSGYRGRGTATTCLDGPCNIETTLFWKASCIYSSSSRNPECGTAYTDAGLSMPVPGSSTGTECPWHWGLVSARCNVTSEFGSSHEGGNVFVGTPGTYQHAYSGRPPEDPAVQVWVR